jgi:hypothetical protein
VAHLQRNRPPAADIHIFLISIWFSHSLSLLPPFKSQLPGVAHQAVVGIDAAAPPDAVLRSRQQQLVGSKAVKRSPSL